MKPMKRQIVTLLVATYYETHGRDVTLLRARGLTHYLDFWRSQRETPVLQAWLDTIHMELTDDDLIEVYHRLTQHDTVQ